MNKSLCKIFGIMIIPLKLESMEELRLIQPGTDNTNTILGIKMCKLTKLIINEEISIY